MTRTTRTVTAAAIVLLALAACTTTPDPAPTPTPEPTGPWPAADIAPLTPPDPAPSDLEQTTAVQVIRETMTVLAWANLTNTSHFAQFTQWIDPNSHPAVIGMDHKTSASIAEYPWVAVGPDPAVPVSLTENPDGTTTVRTCASEVDEVSKADGTPRPAGFGLSHTADITLSPLTPDEIATLEAQGLTPPPLWVREYQAVSGECDDSAVVAQRFENWQDVAPIGDY